MTATPRHGHAPIAMRKREKRYGHLERPGDYYFLSEWSEEPAIYIALPYRDAWTLCRLPLRRGESEPGKWGWDGDEDRPTITPSVNHVGIWHGFVRKGELVEA